MRTLSLILSSMIFVGCTRTLEDRVMRSSDATSVENYEIGDYPFEKYTSEAVDYLSKHLQIERNPDTREIVESRLHEAKEWDKRKRIEWAEFVSEVSDGDRVLIVQSKNDHPRTEFVAIYRSGLEVRRFWLRGNGGMASIE